MKLFKRNTFGHILFIKRWLNRILGVISHGRYHRFNELQIEGSEIIRDLPDTNVLFVSNHQNSTLVSGKSRIISDPSICNSLNR
jgi:1-acyl-sn-glycerol-3-phosphate acyltransferase